MSEELLINVSPQETRIANIENGVLAEVHIERAAKRGLVGNIYKGKVVRVLPGMDAAFIDIGLDRAAFLHVSDIANTQVKLENGETRHKSIRECAQDGAEILVQVVKDPLGTKGARLTTHLALASRFMVYLPKEQGIGLSSKIDNDTERQRLKGLLRSLLGENAEKDSGYIVRTAAENASQEALKHDVEFLKRLWQAICTSTERVSAGNIIYEDLPLALRVLRDLSDKSLERIRIDSRETFQRAVEFAKDFLPDMAAKIEHYPGERPIFDLYNIEDEIQRALNHKVLLKSGGYLIIDQTESMTTIDVNTGAFVGHRNLEETIFKTNLEAAQAIARQLRLRNLGGIIIIDFIDMLEEEHRRQVLRALEKSLDRDTAKAQMGQVSPLGLVEMTRKRTRESLELQLCEPCPTCSGAGRVRTAETVSFEISREIVRQVRQFDVRQLTVIASPSVIDLLLGDQSDYFAELEAFVGIPIRLQAESMYTQEQYDVVLV